MEEQGRPWADLVGVIEVAKEKVVEILLETPKKRISKPWSVDDTDLFYLALATKGCNFEEIAQYFPDRSIQAMKRKHTSECNIHWSNIQAALKWFKLPHCRTFYKELEEARDRKLKELRE